MPSGPPKPAETIVSILIPPASREEVVGDLYERYTSPGRYCVDALSTIPFVIASRIRRTSDPQSVLMLVFSLFLSFLGAAWFKDRGLLSAHSSLLRLAIPCGVAMLGLIFEDAYAKPGPRTPLSLSRGPMLGIGMALGLELLFRVRHSHLAIPGWTIAYGCALGLVLTTSVRMMLPPAIHRFQGSNVPADWLKPSSANIGSAQASIRIVKALAAVVAFLIIVTWIANEGALPGVWLLPWLLILALAIFMGYQTWKKHR